MVEIFIPVSLYKRHLELVYKKSRHDNVIQMIIGTYLYSALIFERVIRKHGVNIVRGARAF